MVSYIAYVIRGLGDAYDPHGETLILASLRIMQDCPANAIASRRVIVPPSEARFLSNESMPRIS